jgi:hypothetical protein
MAVEIPLNFKYRARKPRGRSRADYSGNSGKHRHKGNRGPVVGTGRKGVKNPRSGL